MSTIIPFDSPHFMHAELERGFQKMREEDPFTRGREDRVAGRPCRDNNGRYLDGWYSLPNDYKP